MPARVLSASAPEKLPKQRPSIAKPKSLNFTIRPIPIILSPKDKPNLAIKKRQNANFASQPLS
jgi:hypothetical protein